MAQNALICETLLAGIKTGKYSRVLVFVDDVAQAKELAEVLSRRGIGARVLSEVASDTLQVGLLSEFKQSAVSVLIKVATLTGGLGASGLDAIVVTQPTGSEDIRSKMPGRGARTIDGQGRAFWIVELGDDQALRAGKLLTGPPPPFATDPFAAEPFATDKALPRVHRPAPKTPKYLGLDDPQDLAGLIYVEDQTFGVEVEFTSPLGPPDSTGLVYPTPKWREVALLILQAIERVASQPVDKVPRNYHEVLDTGSWRVEFDRSAGWEVVSPVLRNQSGLTELTNVLSALGALLQQSDRLHLNYRTGLHLTLGSGFTDDEQVRGLVRLGQVLEPGLFTLVSPSRLYDFHNGRYSLDNHNQYCRPLRQLEINVDELGLTTFRKANPYIRYRTVNLSHVARDDQRIEIRLHNGTTDYRVVLAWISLWMTLFNRARFQWPQHGSTLPIFPGGDVAIASEQARSEDIFALLAKVGVHLDPILRASLVRRRASLLEQWNKVVPLRVQSWRRWW